MFSRYLSIFLHYNYYTILCTTSTYLFPGPVDLIQVGTSDNNCFYVGNTYHEVPTYTIQSILYYFVEQIDNQHLQR